MVGQARSLGQCAPPLKSSEKKVSLPQLPPLPLATWHGSHAHALPSSVSSKQALFIVNTSRASDTPGVSLSLIPVDFTPKTALDSLTPPSAHSPPCRSSGPRLSRDRHQHGLAFSPNMQAHRVVSLPSV